MVGIHKMLVRIATEKTLIREEAVDQRRNTGSATKVESAICNDRRHTVGDLTEIRG